MLLFIPVIATLINFARYAVGFKMLGIYAPMILSFAYIQTGIRYGLLITFAVIAATMVTYRVLRNVRMHYLSRISINYILISIFIIIFITLNEASPIRLTTDQHNFAEIPPLGIVLIATLSDFFIKQYVKKDLFTSLRSLMETVLIAFIGWSLLRIGTFTDFLLNNLWFLIVLLGLNLYIGKYSGMRLKEFARFNNVMSQSPEDK